MKCATRAERAGVEVLRAGTAHDYRIGMHHGGVGDDGHKRAERTGVGKGEALELLQSRGVREHEHLARAIDLIEQRDWRSGVSRDGHAAPLRARWASTDRQHCA
jgi:hypothetical protein